MSWIPNQIMAVFWSSEGCKDQILHNAIAIAVYKIVQTGPNNQEGGLKEGLFKERYQLLTELAVAKPPIAAAA